jgi:hypothetical protein
MRNRVAIYEQDTINNQRIKPFVSFKIAASDLVEKNTVPEIITAEGGENFCNYVEWLGLDKDPNLVVLSSLHHYYFDEEEMKNVKTVINLKELNYIKDLKSFFHSVFHNLTTKTYFIGCFTDNKKQNGFALKNSASVNNTNRNSEAVENGIISRIPFLNMLYSLMDSKTYNHLSRNSVTSMVQEHGFKILDMTELNGLTFFCAQRLKAAN